MKVSASRMQALINDLLSFSRNNSAEKEFVPTSLNTLLDEVHRALHENIQWYNCLIAIKCKPLAGLRQANKTCGFICKTYMFTHLVNKIYIFLSWAFDIMP